MKSVPVALELAPTLLSNERVPTGLAAWQAGLLPDLSPSAPRAAAPTATSAPQRDCLALASSLTNQLGGQCARKFNDATLNGVSMEAVFLRQLIAVW